MTYLSDDLALIDGEPVLKAALAYWLAACEERRPICIGCRSGFVDRSAEPAAYLFAVSPMIPGAVSTSAFCVECWAMLPMSDIEVIANRVLRRLLPRGVLEAIGGSP